MAYYEMIEDLQGMIEELHFQYKESKKLMHEGYEQKYQQLKADMWYDKILRGHEK